MNIFAPVANAEPCGKYWVAPPGPFPLKLFQPRAIIGPTKLAPAPAAFGIIVKS